MGRWPKHQHLSLINKFQTLISNMDLFSDTPSLLSSDICTSFDSIEDGATEPWYSLLRNFTNSQLGALSATFKGNQKNALNKDEFVGAIDEIFGNAKYSLQAVLTFQAIDTKEEGRISWDQFLDFVISNWTRKGETKVSLGSFRVFTVPHVQRETIVKIVLIETENYFCYAIFAKHGQVGIYDGNMNFLTSYYVIMTREDISREDKDRRRRNRWITDAIFCPNMLMLFVASSTRSITVYEAAGLKHVPLWLIVGIPNVVQSLCFVSKPNEATLFLGLDNGHIIMLNFVQPKIGLLRKKHNDKLSFFYWIELPDEKEYLVIKNWGKIHGDDVLHIQYIPENDTIVSCSRDSELSVVEKHATNKIQPYTFKMRKGTSCFAVSWTLKILITGSDDGAMRLWNTVMTSKPIATLNGHQAGIADVALIESQNVFFSCARDGSLKLWDLIDQKCLQTIKIKYPPFKVLGRAIEWGKNSIHPGPKRCAVPHKANERLIPDKWERSNILVSCCNYLAKVKLNFANKTIEETFDMPVLQSPPLQNSVLIPTTWKLYDDEALTDDNKTTCDEGDDAEAEEHLKKLSFIMEKDLLSENEHNDINYKIATLEAKKLLMQDPVSKGAPYLALQLYEIEELRLSPDLPVPNNTKIRSFVEKTYKMLADADNRTQIFSEPSSSRSRSSRSSVVEFEY